MFPQKSINKRTKKTERKSVKKKIQILRPFNMSKIVSDMMFCTLNFKRHIFPSNVSTSNHSATVLQDSSVQSLSFLM